MKWMMAVLAWSGAFLNCCCCCFGCIGIPCVFVAHADVSTTFFIVVNFCGRIAALYFGICSSYTLIVLSQISNENKNQLQQGIEFEKNDGKRCLDEQAPKFNYLQDQIVMYDAELGESRLYIWIFWIWIFVELILACLAFMIGNEGSTRRARETIK